MANNDKSTQMPTESSRPIPWHRVLEVPFAQKDLAKAAGAHWDPHSKRWYAPPDANLEKLAKWMITMLDVPFAEKDLAKAAGAQWNRDASFWFAPAHADLEKLDKWIIAPLEVSFAEKDLAKAAGARWNGDLKLWYAPPAADLTKLDKWLPGKDRTLSAPNLDTKLAVLDVPREQKDLAKAGGARWNSSMQLWYAPAGADLEKLNKWIPTPERAQQLLETAAKRRSEPKKPLDWTRVIEVPFKENDLAKAAGARFDGNAKVWFIPDGADEAEFARWKRFESTLDLNQPGDNTTIKAQGQEKTPETRDVSAPKTDAPAKDSPTAVSSKPLEDMGIHPHVLNAWMFRDRWVQVDDKVLFPHDPAWAWDKNVTEPSPGEVLKNPPRMNQEEFGRNHEALSAEGAERTFWQSRRPADIERVVVVERAIDALSYHQLKPDEHTLFLSTGGGPLSPEQKKTLSEGRILGLLVHHPGDTVRTNPEPPVVVGAFSSSKIGAQLARELKESLPPGITCERNAPTHSCRHWNDVVQLKERSQNRSQDVKPKSKGLHRSR